jgi:invasion protein IalB
MVKALAFCSICAAAAALILAAGGASAQAPAPPGNAVLPGGANSVQETYDDWRVACTLQDGAKHCGLSQQQFDNQSKQRVLAIEFTAPVADKIEGALILPFGLALERGVVLQVDDGPAGPVQHFRTCLPAGCLVPLSFDAKLIAAARKGTALKLKASADGGKDIALSISLKGFSPALDRTAALMK